MALSLVEPSIQRSMKLASTFVKVVNGRIK